MVVWEGLDWVEDYAYGKFTKYERKFKLAVIHCSEAGELGRLLAKSHSQFQYVEQLGNLIEFLYRVFKDTAEEIVPPDLAKEIIAFNAINREER